MSLAVLLFSCAGLQLPAAVMAGANAAWTAPEGTWISEFSGKMNVPRKSAKFYNGHPTFLWPGYDPSGQASGLFQPVLTLGQGGRRDPDEPWTIANWFSRCGPYDPAKKVFGAKYCHDDYQNVNEGDVLSWSATLACRRIRHLIKSNQLACTLNAIHDWLAGCAHLCRYVKRVKDTKVFPMEFEMGWASLTNTSQFSGPFVQNISRGGRFMWATEAELYFPPNNMTTDPDYEFLPRSPYNIWDIVMKDQVCPPHSS